MNRRQLLATMATSTATLAGCISSSGDNTGRVATDSEVLKQATNDHPSAIRFSLTNRSDDLITVSAKSKKPFVNFPRLTGDSGTLVLLPTTDPHVFADVASTMTNGCWRFSDADGNEINVVYNDIDDRLTLDPGHTHHVTHQLFYEGKESDCFPNGYYTADHTVEFHDAETTVTFNVQVTFSDKRISGVEVYR